MSEVRIVQIRKKGGLDSIVKEKNSKSKITPMLYHSKSRNPKEDGDLEGEYKGKTILDTKHFISPYWSDLKKRWSFHGSGQKLSELIDKMKLRYPQNHNQAGQIIKASENDAERLTNRFDDVFTHPDMYGKYFMQNGRVSLNLSDPRQEFLYLCFKGDPSVDDKASDEPVNKFIQAGSKYELVSPKKENQTKKRDTSRKVRAYGLLGAMENDEERMRAICTIMSLPQYSKSTDVSGLYVLLGDMAVENETFVAKFNKTYQDRFIELAEMNDEDLNLNGKVFEARNRGLLRKRKGHYLLNGEKIDGVDDDIQLVKYFQNPKNQEHYLKLLDLLEDAN